MYTPLPLEIPPGIVKEDTATGVKGRWIDGNLVRFWKGKPERWQGWQNFGIPVLGEPARGALSWRALDGARLVAWGTASKLYVSINGTRFDITPAGLTAGLIDSQPNATLPSQHARTWTLAKWGEDLVACPRGGKIYHWDYTNGGGTPAQEVAGAPATALGVFSTETDRHLIAYGAHDGVANDPLRLAWPNQETLDEWTPLATNTAGDLRAEEGNEIVGVIRVRGGYLVMTDTSAYFFRYIGPPLVFSLERLDSSCGLIAPHAGVEMGGVCFWMGEDHFWTYDGIVRPIPCDLHQWVFGDGGRNLTQRHKIIAGRNRQFNEVIFFYPDAAVSENNRFVSFNPDGWAPGVLSRTSWIDEGVAESRPIATDPAGNVFVHNVGTVDHNGNELPYFLESGEIEFRGEGIAAGETVLRARRVLPDFQRLTGTHELRIFARKSPQGPAVEKGPYAFSAGTDAFSVRATGRSFRFQMSGAGDFRLGQPEVKVQPIRGR